MSLHKIKNKNMIIELNTFILFIFAKA